jgi:P27 family predicted phage terminase small subunit
MVKRKTRVWLRAPEWLSVEAFKVWKKVKRQAAGLDLLDNLDAEMLAVYCDAVVQYREEAARLKRMEVPEGRSDLVKSVQSWARLIASYAEKLGFTPTGRARLVKKRADELKDDFGDEFDN